MKSGLDHAKVLLEKAGNDLKLAEIGLDHGAPTDTIAFHLQQAAEKTLKALLASRSIVYPKTMTSMNYSIYCHRNSRQCSPSVKSS